MITTAEQAISWIKSRQKFGIIPGLKRMSWMLEQFNHPERRLKFVHFAGTNGKGSTLTFLRSILQEAGYTVGTFTSPYITCFNEQISINGLPIADDDLIELVSLLRPVVEKSELAGHEPPTEFEVVTMLAILYFSKTCPDIVLLETGLGGRYDSTNVVFPLLSVITNVSFDHMNILGHTMEEIAKEKAGIIKAGVPVITGVDERAALPIIRETAKEKRAKIVVYGESFTAQNHACKKDVEQFDFQSPFGHLPYIELSMRGAHQVKNASLALMAALYLKQYYSYIIDESHLRAGLKQAFWPARFETISDDPLIILDGAHNEAGISSLVTTLKTSFSGKNIHILFAALTTKDTTNMINRLLEVADRITFTSFSHVNANRAEFLYEQVDTQVIEKADFQEDWEKAIQHIIQSVERNEVIIITGSLYFISEIRSYLLDRKNSDQL